MKYLIGIPCMDSLMTKFVQCVWALKHPKDAEAEVMLASGSLIYDARNQIAAKAVTGGFDRVLWLDSDMTFSSDLMVRLAEHLDNGLEFVSGIYVKRKQPIEPVIYEHGNMSRADGQSWLDYPKDQLFEVAACGFGGVMMTTELIRAIGDVYGFPFSPILSVGEDLSFCYRATALGRKLYCDSTIKLGHIGYVEFTEETYLKGRERSEVEDE